MSGLGPLQRLMPALAHPHPDLAQKESHNLLRLSAECMCAAGKEHVCTHVSVEVGSEGVGSEGCVHASISHMTSSALPRVIITRDSAMLILVFCAQGPFGWWGPWGQILKCLESLVVPKNHAGICAYVH